MKKNTQSNLSVFVATLVFATVYACLVLPIPAEDATNVVPAIDPSWGELEVEIAQEDALAKLLGVDSKDAFTKVKELIEKDLDKIDSVDSEGRTLLYLAAIDKKHIETLKLLIENNADLEKTAKNNKTPLQAAFADGNTESIRYLIFNGAAAPANKEEAKEIRALILGIDKQKYYIQKKDLLIPRKSDVSNSSAQSGKKDNTNNERAGGQQAEKLLFNKPVQFIESLKTVKIENPVVEAQRYLSLMDYAETARNTTLYNEFRAKFFEQLKIVTVNSTTDSIELLDDALPSMIRQRNFDGLKNTLENICQNMPSPGRSDNGLLWCTRLSGYALAMGDDTAAKNYFGMLPNNAGDEILSSLSTAIAWKSLDIEKIFFTTDRKGQIIRKTVYSNRVYYLCRIAYYLALQGNENQYKEFSANVHKLDKFFDSHEFDFVEAEALFGHFDIAKALRQKYSNNINSSNRIWIDYLLSFIIRQELLTGEMKDVETMLKGTANIRSIGSFRNAKNNGYDLSRYIGAFYFDYGRGLSRHKTQGEVQQAYESLVSAKTLPEDIAFFKAGIAAGLCDRNQPKEKRAENYAPPVVEQPEVTQTPIPEPSPILTQNSERRGEPTSNRGNLGDRIEKGKKIYNEIRRFIP